jgi:hypothetical protein
LREFEENVRGCVSLKKFNSQGKAVKLTGNSKEESFCRDLVQEFCLWIDRNGQNDLPTRKSERYENWKNWKAGTIKHTYMHKEKMFASPIFWWNIASCTNLGLKCSTIKHQQLDFVFFYMFAAPARCSPAPIHSFT